MSIRALVRVILLLLWFPAAFFPPAFAAAAPDPVRTARFWGESWRERPWPERLRPAPAELIAYLTLENERAGFSERPRPADPSPEFGRALAGIAARLPDPVGRLAATGLVGVFLVDGLGSTGFCETVLDDRGRESFIFIVLDRGLLIKTRANAWATWKENSAFRPDPEAGPDLSLIIETPEGDTPLNAIRYIMLHELGHALGLLSRAHPSWSPDQGPLRLDGPFTRLSWQAGPDGRPVSRFDDVFPERKALRFYGFERAGLSRNQIMDTYDHLSRSTNFASLAAAASLWEDFAESFATWVHVVLDDRPWQVRLERKGRTATVIESCWRKDRCPEKRAFMETWFRDPSSLR
ncbi:MAG: hypothetical protein KKB20_18955 [Proteobacteria bacterium]|nr:hypothetical protein [Pseudomonadota bacterium]